MNGEVVSFDPRKFYTAEEFQMLPPEHKVTLINGYISRYDVGIKNISEIVFGKSKTWLYYVLNKSGIVPMIHTRSGKCKEKAKLSLKADVEAYRGVKQRKKNRRSQ